jgi:hypothetical protein
MLPALNPCCEHGFPVWDPVSGSKGNNLLLLPIVSQAGAPIAQDRLTIVGYNGLVLNHGGERGNGKGMSTKR